jgi:mannose-6-phosphate isomerase-like protein (cupin superfamily)
MSNDHLRRPASPRRSVSGETSLRVTNRADKPLGDLVPGVRRAMYFDAAEGSAQLTFGAAEIDPGKEIPVHRHKVGDRYVEEGFFVLEGEGEVRVGDQTTPIRAGSFCVMSPAESFHSIRNTGDKTLKFVMCFAGTGVQMERKT